MSSNLIPGFPVSTVSVQAVVESSNLTCEDMLEQVRGMVGFVGPNPLFKAEEHKELLQRVSSCFKDIVKNVNISLSIPNFIKSEAVLKNVNCKKDLDKLKALCERHLKSAKDKQEQKLVRSLNVSREKGLKEFSDAKLLQATELVAKSEPLMKELNKKAYLSKCGKRLMQRFDDITKWPEGSYSDVSDRNKSSSRSLAIEDITLEDLLKFDSFVFTEKEEKKPSESFFIRQENLQNKISAKLARTKSYERMSDLEKTRSRMMEPELDAAFRQMANECPKKLAKLASKTAEIRRLEAIYQKTVKKNIETDKELIRKKTKLLTLLSTWVKKYDTDVSQKMLSLSLAKEELDEQKDIAKKFFKEYDRVSAEYSDVVQCQLVQERLAEYRIEVEKAKAAKSKARKWY